MRTPNYQPGKARHNAAVFIDVYRAPDGSGGAFFEGTDSDGIYFQTNNDGDYMTGSDAAREIRRSDIHHILSDDDVIDAVAQLFCTLPPMVYDCDDTTEYCGPSWREESTEAGPAISR